jgi:hypothetical protein
MTELTKRNSLTEDTPRDAVTNALRLHLHNFAYKTFKIKLSHVACWQFARFGVVLYQKRHITRPWGIHSPLKTTAALVA